MPINKPTHDQLIEWEALLEAEGLEPLETDPRHVPLEDTHGVRIPAQPVRDGGMFWHKRSDIFHSKQDRKIRQPNQQSCAACKSPFESRRGSRFCSRNCQMRELMRAKRVSAKLPKKGEEINQ